MRPTYWQHESGVLMISALDILFLGRIFPKRASIMAKQELKWSPLLGQFSQSLRGVCLLRH